MFRNRTCGVWILTSYLVCKLREKKYALDTWSALHLSGADTIALAKMSNYGSQVRN